MGLLDSLRGKKQTDEELLAQKQLELTHLRKDIGTLNSKITQLGHKIEELNKIEKTPSQNNEYRELLRNKERCEKELKEFRQQERKINEDMAKIRNRLEMSKHVQPAHST